MRPQVREALARLSDYENAPLSEYRDAITDELCRLTQSTISYFAVMNLTEDRLTMIGWSKSAMGNCSVIDKPIVYAIEETGLWGDAVRERKPVITNDYPNCTKPTKKGYPEGHVPVRRHLNLPIFEGNHVALVVGVGNKATDYTMEDASLIQELMDEAWRTFQQSLWSATW